jgi:hypothetical protein
VNEDPLPRWGQRPSDVVVGIDDGVPGVAVAHFQIDNVAAAAVQQVMRIPRAGFEPGAHARPQLRFAGIGRENGLALDDVDELVLSLMRMAQRRHAARRQSRKVHPELGQPERVTSTRLSRPATRTANGSG